MYFFAENSTNTDYSSIKYSSTVLELSNFEYSIINLLSYSTFDTISYLSKSF